MLEANAKLRMAFADKNTPDSARMALSKYRPHINTVCPLSIIRTALEPTPTIRYYVKIGRKRRSVERKADFMKKIINIAS